MVRAKLKTPEGRKFLLALLVVFMIAAACVGRATIVGVIEQYNIPLSAWTTSMYVLQSAMILFTARCSPFCLPFRWAFSSGRTR